MASSNIVYGVHAVKAALLQHGDIIVNATIVEGKLDFALTEILKLAKKHNIDVRRTSKDTITKIAGSKQHQGVVLTLNNITSYGHAELLDEIESLEPGKHLKLLILDEVQDPHNLGACLRSADAFGVHAIIVPKNRAAHVNATVRKVACGAAEVVPVVVVTNLARAIKELQDLGFWIIGTAADAKDTLANIDTKQNLAIVLGAEGDGMRRLTKEACDQLVKIPMQGYVSSLNVSVSAGVILYHLSVN